MDLKRKNYQRNTSWNAPYTFSGKEKDVETGYGYVKKLRFFSSLAFGNEKQVFHYAHYLRRFGARYYDSGLSIWLSVDPMSDKYPSLTPYAYCANNPVILVDPDGREVFIDGDMAMNAFNILVASNPNLQLTYNEENQKLEGVAGENPLTEDEQKLLNAITSKNVVVNLEVSSSSVFQTAEGETLNIGGGGGYFLGNVLNDDKTMAFTRQGIDLPTLSTNFTPEDMGAVISHEITESYVGGLISIGSTPPRAARAAKVDNPEPIYNAAHDDRRTVSQPESIPARNNRIQQNQQRLREQEQRFNNRNNPRNF